MAKEQGRKAKSAESPKTGRDAYGRRIKPIIKRDLRCTNCFACVKNTKNCPIYDGGKN